MSLVSNTFLIFAVAVVFLYYIVPKKMQWIALLLFSYVYYLWGGANYLVYIVFSTAVTYGFALLTEHLRLSGKPAGLRKKVTALGLICNFGMLGIVKYSAFAAANLNALFHLNLPHTGILFPLGISFYTFQSSGYLLDVYWEKVSPEKNPARYALFVSYFPQLLQGPISSYGKLAHQLFEPHAFEWERITRGAERILWGFFKKIVISDWAAVFTDAIYRDPETYSGLSAFALIFYGIQLYADFSGGIDVVIGISEMLGITLSENFRRPYLAVSIADFWKRWHITLGEWMMTYVFYPVSVSKWMMRFGKWSRSAFGRRTGRVLPVALAELIVFFLVGVWHGASWQFIIYGLANGVIIAFSELMAGTYRSMKKALHIAGDEPWYRFFMIARTYVIANVLLAFDPVSGTMEALRMIRRCFTSFHPAQLLTIPAGRGGTAFTPYALLIVAAGTALMVAKGLFEERGVDLRDRINRLPLPAAAAICLLLLISIGCFGSTAAPRGFIYAQF